MGTTRKQIGEICYLDGKNASFRGEYMAQYSFAERTCGELIAKQN